MDQSGQLQGLGFGEPAVYRIAVGGHLDERTAEDIGDAQVEVRNPDVTCLLLRVRDQTGLSGALDALYGLHRVILSVELLSRPDETRL
ncbi:MAG: hypothetical protein WBG92_06430 [Thiohalocapsa sp.]